MSEAGDTHPVWNRETILDALVNIVPLGIILFFVAVFLLMTPATWGSFGLITVIQMALLLVPLVALAILTYLIAERI